VLDLGRGVGALVLYAPAALAGTEIEISPGSDPAARRTHAVVQGRAAGPAGRTADGRTVPYDARPAIYAAVYPGLAAGQYTIWRDSSTPAGTADVAGGQVTTWHWPA
jgi:hypothetical protein